MDDDYLVNLSNPYFLNFEKGMTQVERYLDITTSENLYMEIDVTSKYFSRLIFDSTNLYSTMKIENFNKGEGENIVK